MGRRRQQHASFFVKRLALAPKKTHAKEGEIIYIIKNLHMWEIYSNFACKIGLRTKR